MRVVSAALALACGLAFFAVCLGTCLAADEHACCKKGQGFTVTAASTDCCHVTSGVSSKATTSLAQAAAVATRIPQASCRFAPAAAAAAVPAAPSPPFVLRI